MVYAFDKVETVGSTEGDCGLIRSKQNHLDREVFTNNEVVRGGVVVQGVVAFNSEGDINHVKVEIGHGDAIMRPVVVAVVKVGERVVV